MPNWLPRLLVLVAVGCAAEATGRKPVHPTRGAMFVQGKPAAGARLTFHKAGEVGPPRGSAPFAVVDADGTFAVTTYITKDGAPEGDYVVTAYWPATVPSAATNSDDQPLAADRLRNAYADPKTTKLRATVKPGTNELEPFRLN